MNFKINVTANTKQATSAFGGFYNKLRNVNNSLSNISKDANRVGDGFSGMTKAFSGFNQVLGVSKIYMLGTEMAGAIKASLDMIETVNLFNVSLGQTAEASNKALVSLSELYGLDLTNLQNSVGTYALLARSMGMTSEQADQLSNNTAKLALDLSSLTNVPINQVMADLRSGLVGQSETVYKYGIDVTEAGLETEAMNQGIKKSVRDMSQGEKMALRYATMIRQTGLAQGDFARTISSPANQLKVLKEQFITLARALGSIFIPMLNAILPYLNAFVSILIDLANAVASFFGFEAPEVANSDIGSQIGSVVEGADDAGDSLDDATKSAKKFKSALVGIDEINLLPMPDAEDAGAKGKKKSGGGDVGSILGDIKLPSVKPWLDNIKAVSDEIKAKLIPILKVAGIIITAIGLAITAWKITSMIMTLTKAGGLFARILEVVTMIKKIGVLPTLSAFFPEVAIFAGVFSALTGLVLLIKGLFDIFRSTEPSVKGFTEALIGLALVCVGLSVLFTPLVGGVVLLVGALALLGIGLYKAFADSLPKVEVLGEGISDITKKKVEPLLKVVDDLKQSLLGLELRGSVITDETISDVKSKVQKITKIITDELDADKNEALKKLSPLKSSMSKEQFDKMLQDANGYYDQSLKLVSDNEKEIAKIMGSAEGRELKKEELDKINELIASSNEVGLKSLSDGSKEYRLIMQRLKDNSVSLTVEQSSEILKESKKSHDNQIKEANTLYDEQMLLAEQFYGENGVNNKSAYDEMIKNAKKHRDDTIRTTDEQWEKVKISTKTKLGENGKWIDTETGEQKSRWKVFTEDVSSKFSEMWEKCKQDTKRANPELYADFQSIRGNISTGWNNFTTWVGDRWNGMWEYIRNKATENKEPVRYPIDDMLGKISGGFQNFASGVHDKWNAFWEHNKYISRNHRTGMANDAETGLGGIYSKFDNFKNNFAYWWNNFWANLSINLSNAWNAFKVNLAPYFNPVLAQCESFVNWMIDGINRAILSWNHIKSAMGISGWTYPISKISFPRLARGGSLDTGAFFQAGENGKMETIGSYQGKTTVMPLENTDFVQAMYSAVYDAVTNAMGAGSGESGDLVLKVGESEFARVAVNSINNMTRREGRLALKI